MLGRRSLLYGLVGAGASLCMPPASFLQEGADGVSRDFLPSRRLPGCTRGFEDVLRLYPILADIGGSILGTLQEEGINNYIGSSILIDRCGTMLMTNHQLVEEREICVLGSTIPQNRRLQISYTLPEIDAALVSLPERYVDEHPELRPVSIARPNTLPDICLIVAYSYEYQHEGRRIPLLHATLGFASTYAEQVTALSRGSMLDFRCNIVFDAHVVMGMSGGGIFNTDGELVAMLRTGHQGGMGASSGIPIEAVLSSYAERFPQRAQEAGIIVAPVEPSVRQSRPACYDHN